MKTAGYYKKYIILEELDSGFGTQASPEGFARFEGNKHGITLTVQVKNLREGTAPYTVILVYDKNEDLGVLRAGNLEIQMKNGFFRKNLDYDTIQTMGMRPDDIRYVLVAAEHRERGFLPLIGIGGKAVQWDEAIRQRLLKRDKGNEEKEPFPQSLDSHVGNKSMVDDRALEEKLKESFESMDPFFNPRHDYVWYRINDLARLSNLLFACNLQIPLFANPKILVGLFKYRHLLAGIYRSDRNQLSYFVLGVPAKGDSDGKPFENICRWVEVNNTEYGDMKGYWLVYINLINGEFVS